MTMSKIAIYFCTFALAVVFCLPAQDPSQDGNPIGNPYYCEDWGIKFEKDKVVVDVPGQCLKAECVNPNINEFIYTICPKVNLPSDCHASEVDTTKPYPDCCAKSVCKKSSKKT